MQCIGLYYCCWRWQNSPMPVFWFRMILLQMWKYMQHFKSIVVLALPSFLYASTRDCLNKIYVLISYHQTTRLFATTLQGWPRKGFVLPACYVCPCGRKLWVATFVLVTDSPFSLGSWCRHLPGLNDKSRKPELATSAQTLQFQGLESQIIAQL